MLDDKAQEFYRRALKKHREGPRALGFDLSESQSVRFDVAARLVGRVVNSMTTDQYSLLDVGCGTGDFPRYLDHVGLTPQRYLGLDLMPEMIERAAELEAHHESMSRSRDYVVGDIREQHGPRLGLEVDYDVSVALATFCLKADDWSQQDSLRLVQDTVMAMANWTRRLMIVTVLSTWKTEILPEEMVVDPTALFLWAKSHWSRVDLLHSYAPHDMMLVIWLEEGEWWRAWRARK